VRILVTTVPSFVYTWLLLALSVGLTGVILLGVFVLIWIFARKGIRRGKGFEVFYLSHLLYIVWFAFMLVHAKSFWLWGIWSLAGFAIELIVKRFVKRQISFVEKANPLPGGTIELRLHRPAGFTFQPGDYICLRIPRVSRFRRPVSSSGARGWRWTGSKSLPS